MQSRTQLLANLLNYSHPIEHTLTGLRQFSWDAEAALIILSRNHLIQLLERYLRGDFANSDVEVWANAIEGREDIDYESGHEDALQEIIHTLANPILTEPLDNELAGRLLKTLHDTHHNSQY